MRGIFLGVPDLIKTIVYLGLYWGLPIWGKYHLKFQGLGM